MRKLKRNEDRKEVVVHELLSNARINIKLMGNNESKLLGYIYIYRERERESYKFTISFIKPHQSLISLIGLDLNPHLIHQW